jgi:hypothetical protein
LRTIKGRQKTPQPLGQNVAVTFRVLPAAEIFNSFQLLTLTLLFISVDVSTIDLIFDAPDNFGHAQQEMTYHNLVSFFKKTHFLLVDKKISSGLCCCNVI